MRYRAFVVATSMALFIARVLSAQQPTVTSLTQDVANTERAFAKSMADRDFAAFSSFLSDEAVFFSGAKPIRGKAQVEAAWKAFFQAPTAPFSWEPAVVEVLDSGTLAISSGPVHNAEGKLTATYQSIWRLEKPGTWRIVFDKGSPACDCAKP